MKDNVILGTVGAVIGALLGTVLWVLIGQMGFIAGIAGYAIVYCSVKGYELLGRAVSRTGIVICVVLSLLMILAAEYVSTGIVIYQVFAGDYSITILDAMKSVPEFLTDIDLRKELLMNLVIGYGLAIWASFSFVRSLWSGVQAGEVQESWGQREPEGPWEPQEPLEPQEPEGK